MTRTSTEPRTEEKVVVFFDMCSSSTILEDLHSTGNLKAMRDLLIEAKKALIRLSEEEDFDSYKFIGDGWVLLFPADVSGKHLINTLELLSRFYRDAVSQHVTGLLQSQPEVMGLTFGIDRGSLIRLVMMQRTEYIGRALNVASRLQSAIKDGDSKPAYKVLFSKHAFEGLGLPQGYRPIWNVSRRLRNIRDGRPCDCIKLKLNVGTTAKKKAVAAR